jgi:hypothetical protein
MNAGTGDTVLISAASRGFGGRDDHVRSHSRKLTFSTKTLDARALNHDWICSDATCDWGSNLGVMRCSAGDLNCN